MTPSASPTALDSWKRNLGKTSPGLLHSPRPPQWWTGCAPEKTPGLDAEDRLHSLPQLHLDTATRTSVQAYFDNTWTLTEVLFSALTSEEAFYCPPSHGLRHPLIFYYGHPPCVYVNKLRVAGILDGPVNAEFERLFETGVDEMSWDNMAKNDETWPSVDAVLEYRQQVYRVVSDLIATHPDLRPGARYADGSLLWALAMGFEHERIHLETSCVLMRELPVALLQRPRHWPANHPSVPATEEHTPHEGRDFPANPMVRIPGGTATLGKPFDFPTFGWDNEYGAARRNVAPFSASNHLVSQGEYHAFVVAGGYHEPRWWSETGWAWRAFRNVKWPTFWVPSGPAGSHQYRLRLPFEEIPMPWDWPVEVNAHEARAFAKWREEQTDLPYRLPTEAEHRLLRAAETSGAPRNSNLLWGSPWPVQSGAEDTNGLRGTMGNVWTWCEDDFHPLPGHRLDPLYDDFSAPCYDGEHTMILGGSFVSTGDEASEWARFHFRPHFHQFAGIRLVQAAHNPAVKLKQRGEALAALAELPGPATYETRRSVDEYLLMHFGAPEDVMPWPEGPRDGLDFAARTARLLMDACDAHGVNAERALDLGCAVGGASFELARRFQEVLGADWSQAFIDAAVALRDAGNLTFTVREEGTVGYDRQIVVPQDIDGTRLGFERADAHHPPTSWGTFDAVLMANLIDRLADPRLCLQRLPRLVRPGGIVLITTPFTWLTDYTPEDHWLGGFEREGGVVRGPDGLRAALEKDFDFLSSQNVPFIIREHSRKFQWSVAFAGLWRRKLKK
ncbi:MAG: 5-histidylcysteine sulfoxide synthase [Candidatus Sericytochromatia bacterium]|nr:5-histidylcysteine sulfoxide synthase [Candidatus Sericytochromatia bacterium]